MQLMSTPDILNVYACMSLALRTSLAFLVLHSLTVEWGVRLAYLWGSQVLTPWLNSTRTLELACVEMRPHKVPPAPVMKVR